MFLATLAYRAEQSGLKYCEPWTDDNEMLLRRLSDYRALGFSARRLVINCRESGRQEDLVVAVEILRNVSQSIRTIFQAWQPTPAQLKQPN
jgi:hypothetical protein